MCVLPVSIVFFLFRHGAHRDLHSFPTRRSSDLYRISGKAKGALAVLHAGRNRSAVAKPTGGHSLYRETSDGEWELVNVDRKSTRLNSSHVEISYAVFCLKKKSPRL